MLIRHCHMTSDEISEGTKKFEVCRLYITLGAIQKKKIVRQREKSMSYLVTIDLKNLIVFVKIHQT